METGGIIRAEEEGGGTKKEEGFTRLVVRLLLPVDSVVSRSGIRGVDADKGRDGICRVGAVGEVPLAGCEGAGIATDW